MLSAQKIRTRLTDSLPCFVFCLFVLQPVMDILSFWVAALAVSNTFTLLLRFLVLGVTLLLGFFLSDRKKIYWIAAAVCLFIGLGHMFAAGQFGYQNIVSDLTNYIRVLQMPLTALCLITFLRQNEKSYDAMKWGILASLLLILAVEVVAVLTKTEPHTYDDGKGYIGWFSNTNSQCAILAMVVPVAMAWMYEKKGLKSPLFWLTALGGFSALYFLGPRLAILGLAASGFGLGLSILLIRPADWKKACVFLAVTLFFLSFISVSPMAVHQRIYEEVQTDRQNTIEQENHIDELPPVDAPSISAEEQARRREKLIEALTPIYTFYAPDFVEMFGARRTIELYNYTDNIKTITATRPKKLQFARLLMEDSPVSSRFFGVELARFTVNGNIYDVENDFHGIYYLYGYVGLFALLAFFLYFVYLIAAALIRDAKKYFTLDAAAWGIALIMCLIHIYFTAGVLRRPNASFYLSATLAAVYYLTKLKNYAGKTSPALTKTR